MKTNFLILVVAVLFTSVSFAQVPVNDEISGAIPLCYNTSVMGSTNTATKGIDENVFCGFQSPTSSGVWYSFIGNGKNIELNTCSGSNYDTRLFLYTGNSGFLTCVTENDNACSNNSRIIFPSVLNENYLLLVTGANLSVGTFGLETITALDSLEINACENYTSPSGNLYTTSTMLYDTLLNVNNCEIVTFIDLTIIQNINTILNILSSSNCSGENKDTIIASSSSNLVNSYNWYDAAAGGTLLHQGSVFAPTISSSATFYAEADASIPAPMPARTDSSVSSGTGGYWFTAPSSFVITSLYVPDEFNTTSQSVSVIKMDNAMAPPTAALITNDFSILYLSQANPSTGPIQVNIPISTGDVIGILGSRGSSSSSLSNADNFTIINGDTAYLTSLGYANELITTAPLNVSDFSFSNFIDIIEFNYITSDICISSTRTSVFVEVYENYLDSIIVQTCDSFISPIGDSYTGSSIFYDTLSTINGCDSIVFVDLTIEYTSSDSLNIIACDTFISPSGKIFTSSNVFTDTLYTNIGCLQLKYIDLTIGKSTLDSIVAVECDSYTSPSGINLIQSANFYDTLNSVLGCDSVIYIDLTINFSFLGSVNIEICDSFISAQNIVYDTSSVFYDTLMTSLGCDSVLLTTLTIHNSSLTNLTLERCDTYISPSGTVYTNSTLFYDSLTSVKGCDSLFLIDLTINNTQVTNLNLQECNSYVSPLGNTYNSSAIINDTLTAVSGCDSVVNINLTINYNKRDSIYPEVCGSYTSPQGSLLTTTSLFNETFTTLNGCDSVVTIFLTVHKEDTIFISPFACGTYTSPAGNVYTSSASFTEVLTSSFGCDSIYSINLTIPPVSSGNISPVVCNQYISPLGFTFTNSQNFTETLTAANGCDSILSINLTVNKTKYDTLKVSTCGEYVSSNGIQYLTSGLYEEQYISTAGCDSFYVLDLKLNPLDITINKQNDVLSSLEFGATYQWFNCETDQEIAGATDRQFIAPENGSYKVIIENGSCEETSECVSVNSITAINNVDLLNVKVYPNPSTNLFIVSFENLIQSQEFVVYDITGKVIKNGLFQSNNGEIDLSDFDSGIYFLNIGNRSIRLLKMH